MSDSWNWQRAHEIWHHASVKLTPNATEMDRIDAITALKRCPNQRLKQFEEVYRLRTFLGQHNSRYLQLLEQIGLVRPLLLQNLMEIRNEIEHDDKRPPKLERCLETLDVVWYFLKSTDAFAKARTTSLVLQYDEEETYWVEITIDIKRTWKMAGHGWLPQEYFFAASAPDCLEILAEELHTKQHRKEQGQHSDKKDTDLYFSGEVVKLPDRLVLHHYDIGG